jgi:hypothetical protein
VVMLWSRCILVLILCTAPKMKQHCLLMLYFVPGDHISYHHTATDPTIKPSSSCPSSSDHDRCFRTASQQIRPTLNYAHDRRSLLFHITNNPSRPYLYMNSLTKTPTQPPRPKHETPQPTPPSLPFLQATQIQQHPRPALDIMKRNVTYKIEKLTLCLNSRIVPKIGFCRIQSLPCPCSPSLDIHTVIHATNSLLGFHTLHEKVRSAPHISVKCSDVQKSTVLCALHRSFGCCTKSSRAAQSTSTNRTAVCISRTGSDLRSTAPKLCLFAQRLQVSAS